MRKHLVGFGLAVVVLLAISAPSYAQLPGAIFTTNSDGSGVNLNIYPSKDAVYLNGGPPGGAPVTAAALPDGTYVFQVTDPSGKTLLSLDAGKCRQFVISGSIMTAVVVTGCEHKTGTDIDEPGAITVQLMPYADTPNNGGEYKAWATPVADYINGCVALGISSALALDTVDCGKAAGDFHGFVPRHSKTDNFKAKNETVSFEVDTYFHGPSYNLIVGICEIWIDTLGVQNTRCSTTTDPFAHVDNPEVGISQIILYNQTGCINFTGDIEQRTANGTLVTTSSFGPTNSTISLPPPGAPGTSITIDIPVKQNTTGTIRIDVYCN
jgi:hypothetical protein